MEPIMVDSHQSHLTHDQTPTRVEVEILRQLRSLKFGALEVQVHDARIVQIERREKTRFDEPRPGR
jgi:hypothetical protein